MLNPFYLKKIQYKMNLLSFSNKFHSFLISVFIQQFMALVQPFVSAKEQALLEKMKTEYQVLFLMLL